MIRKVTSEEADKIIETREPRGQFWLMGKIGDRVVYTGIDNRDGYAWAEDFKSKSSCFTWLRSN